MISSANNRRPDSSANIKQNCPCDSIKQTQLLIRQRLTSVCNRIVNTQCSLGYVTCVSRLENRLCSHSVKIGMNLGKQFSVWLENNYFPAGVILLEPWLISVNRIKSSLCYSVSYHSLLNDHEAVRVTYGSRKWAKLANYVCLTDLTCAS